MKNLDLLKNGVYLWPFTAECALLVHILKANGVQIHCIYDNKKSIWGEAYNGVVIKQVQDNANQTVIVCGYRHYDKAGQEFQCTLLQLKDVLTPDDIQKHIQDLDLETIQRIAPRQMAKARAIEIEMKHEFIGKEFNSDTLVLNAAIIRMTSRCNLRCDKCCSLCHYYESPTDIAIESHYRDIDIIMSKCDYLRRVSIVGGEPLLYPHLYEYLQYITKYIHRIGHVHIVTNGTLALNDKTLEIMSENGIGLWISDYGKISKKADELEKTAVQKGVYVRRHHDITWTDLLHPHEKDDKGQERFNRCWGRSVCPYIYKGKGFPCSFALATYELKMVPYSNENFIDLASATPTDLENFYLKRTKAHDCCSYCSGCDSAMEDIPAAQQLKKPLPLPFSFPETYPKEC